MIYRSLPPSEAIQFYEQAIQEQPEEKQYYWQLGLVLLLNQQVEEAHATWFAGMLDGNDIQIEQWHHELVTLLHDEAYFQEEQHHLDQCLTIRAAIQSIVPNDFENNINYLRIHLKNKTYEQDHLEKINIIALSCKKFMILNHNLWIEIIANLLEVDPINSKVLDILKATIPHFQDSEYLEHFSGILVQQAKNLGYIRNLNPIAAKICEYGLELNPNNFDFAASLADFYQNSDQYQKGVEAARYYLSIVNDLPDRIDAMKMLIKALFITGGRWQESKVLFDEQEKLIHALIQEWPKNLTLEQVCRLSNSYFFALYFGDSPQPVHSLQQKIAELCMENTKKHTPKRITHYFQGYQQRLQSYLRERKPKKLKIGYLSFCLRRHSVGWLARALFEHHDHEKYDIHGYFVTMPDSQDPLQDWYISKVKSAVKITDVDALADAIFEDEIDILVELDSITVDITSSVTMLKPAPIQVTWLGRDASGIPTIDYFIADDYVLPANAQDYYHEKIVRLPQSYIACDGFEVGLPTLRREDLGVPAEAIAYYSVQKGYKRHPDTMRLQLEIIKGVPGSYFLIKGSNDTEDMERAFLMLADEVGVERDRLKFLAVDYSESTHRANMLIADVVLDTYPYNGATTTMETLWMGIPLVTWVGEQFAARNSYTMLINAGVTEGIAHNAREYVEWGIRYGIDPELRHGVNRKLQAARRTAPLWNGRQFARDMEAAYEQMWAAYVAGSGK